MKTLAKVLAILFGVLIIASGLYCLLTPELTYLSIGYAVGVSMVLDAIWHFTAWLAEHRDGEADGWLLADAILSAVFGFFILNSAALQLSVDTFIVFYIATWLVIHGILAIARAGMARRVQKNGAVRLSGVHFYLPLCTGILMLLFGILSMFNPVLMATAIGVFIGLGTISAGASIIVLALHPAL